MLIQLLKEILIRKNLTISTAESCTVGQLARLLTSVSGSSQYYIGGIIAYDYHQKIKHLGVRKSTIVQETVVSEKVAIEMVEGGQKLFGTDIAIATTGVAGPSTDEFHNEVGRIHFAIKIKDKIYTDQFFFPDLEREEFVQQVSQKIMERLKEILNDEF